MSYHLKNQGFGDKVEFINDATTTEINYKKWQLYWSAVNNLHSLTCKLNKLQDRVEQCNGKLSKYWKCDDLTMDISQTLCIVQCVWS